jgi:hypothetical protein
MRLTVRNYRLWARAVSFNGAEGESRSLAAEVRYGGSSRGATSASKKLCLRRSGSAQMSCARRRWMREQGLFDRARESCSSPKCRPFASAEDRPGAYLQCFMDTRHKDFRQIPGNRDTHWYDPFCSKVVGLIGLNMPRALVGRSIAIKLLPKKADEKVADFSHSDNDEFIALRSKAAR